MGDAITALGSFFGDAIWAAPKGDDAVDRVESHIALCTEDGGEVLLELHRGAAKRAAAALADDPNMIENAAVRSLFSERIERERERKKERMNERVAKCAGAHMLVQAVLVARGIGMMRGKLTNIRRNVYC